jgi:hypothetical protein
MKASVRKYIRILDAQTKLITKQSTLTLSGNNWQKERDLDKKLSVKIEEYNKKLQVIEPLIPQEEFEEYLSDRMCCSWEDFKSI